MCNFQEIFNASIEPDVPNKTSNTLYGDGWCKYFDHLDFCLIKLNTLARDPMTPHNTFFDHDMALFLIQYQLQSLHRLSTLSKWSKQ